MKVLKRIGAIFVDVILALLLLISAFSVISSINEKKTGFGNCFGLGALAVQSESMSGTFEKGDLIFCTAFDENKDEVKKGDIVSFYAYINGKNQLNTHEVDHIEDGKIYTKGVANDGLDEGFRVAGDIKAVYTGKKINGFGNVIDFIKDPIGFVICIVVPIVAYIIYQIIYIIRLYNSEKKAEMLEEAKAGTSEDVKDAIIKEYLAKQKQEQEEKEKGEK